MRFAFTDEQLAFQAAVRDVLAKECRPEDLRSAWSQGWSRPRWERLAEVGAVGLTVPEDHGGLGMGALDLVLVLEEAGRSALPEPLAETTAVAVPAVVDSLYAEPPSPGPAVSGAAARADPLRGVAEGRVLLAVGLAHDPLVVGAGLADLLLLQRGDEIHLVQPEGVLAKPQESLDGARPVATVEWDPRPDTCLVGGDRGRRILAESFDRGALGAAAQLLGVSAKLVEMAASHARERKQFGQPIGAFQAVKHMLANALLRLEFARPVVYRAAHSVTRLDAERSRDVSMAKAYASEAAADACRTALQVHGAIGYTWEHDLHLWLKRGWALSAAWGDAAWHRRRVARRVLD